MRIIEHHLSRITERNAPYIYNYKGCSIKLIISTYFLELQKLDVLILT